MAIKYARRRLGLRSSKRRRANAKSSRYGTSSTRRARTRRVRFRRRAKTSTGRLWKYVKKATRSEVKRFDGFCPSNPTYDFLKGGTLTSDLGGVKMAAQGRYLTIACASFYQSAATSPAFTLNSNGEVSELYGGLLIKNQGWRMDRFGTVGLKRGSFSFQVNGSEMFLKYYSLKLMVHVQMPQNWNTVNYQSQKFELWWIEEKITDGVSNLSASDMPKELWDCQTQYFRASSGVSQITGNFEVDGSKPNYKQLNRFNFAFRRKRLDLNTRNVHMKKLYSLTVGEVLNSYPNYTGTWSNGTGAIVKSSEQQPSMSPLVINKSFIIPVNRKIKIRDEQDDQRFLNYCYYLLPMDNTLTYSNSAASEIFRVYMTCEGVFTDK